MTILSKISPSGLRKSLRKRLRTIIRNETGLALTEFAFTAPVFLSLGILGLDTANFVITHMRVSQIALHIADNGSRAGEHQVLVSRKLFESDINDLMIGAERFAKGLDLQANGRVILSSLEQNAGGGQWIHWQRCYGSKTYASTHGVAGDGASGTSFPGMGASGSRIMATAGEAVMFVEVSYDYESISPFSVLDGRTITYTGAYNVRDARDLTQVYQSSPAAPVGSCS